MKFHILSIFFVMVFISFYLEICHCAKKEIIECSTNDDSANPLNDCPICTNTLREPIHTTTCGHEFCKGCIDRWLQDKSTCPICRSSIDSSNVPDSSRSEEEIIQNNSQNVEFIPLIISYEGKHKLLVIS
ncbi:E3 ubiquitin-protein ligase NRDP1-like isoform X6 [Daktulosphaira vitifoliae]|uniref:E3 ubiquitin-protein ligase NRDP1-like isoform X4 n=1 Tax=Daktulosphaira vitifoliae TaxID=58002 RepID=UPI0021AA6516|nr:E3 ubiquitin-protein ligase NRDP1-like isoform X4 [Daktulosphaira vitifoliae]XP_050547473.1 E3 ubiquitin-protein ligase NRDP1-like isoform X5 [Daktulosphaira vitifoliae]XP_050547477.1 E3 ubiquitin-protein ligase NRDP1-like isoform X6 [Daktulosphaira vitifoliae]